MPTFKKASYTPEQMKAFGERLAKIAAEIQAFGMVMESRELEKVVISRHADGAARSVSTLALFRAQVEVEIDNLLMERGEFHSEEIDEGKPKDAKKTAQKRPRKKT